MATKINENLFRISESPQIDWEDEEWEFLAGSLVCVGETVFNNELVLNAKKIAENETNQL